MQDIGCRIYTFLTTMVYILEASEKYKKHVVILDRPNPVGRPIEGFMLEPGEESFVGCGPIPMRHGLTLGEAALWYKSFKKLNVELDVIEMTGYQPSKTPWPQNELPWVNPSPNAPSLLMARCFPGTVMLEGTLLSEGRGTTRPLEIVGAPDFPAKDVLKEMHKLAPQWLKGGVVRTMYFEPTFHKHKGTLCSGLHFHTDDVLFSQDQFKPFRLMSLTFKALRGLIPDYKIWRDFHYEYVKDKLAIDVINGGSKLREWVDDPNATISDFEKVLSQDETNWAETSRPFYLYE
jgi:uncharacterized protein YbbC (DUF1343 family)